MQSHKFCVLAISCLNGSIILGNIQFHNFYSMIYGLIMDQMKVEIIKNMN